MYSTGFAGPEELFMIDSFVFSETFSVPEMYKNLSMIACSMNIRSIFGPECFSTKLARIGESFKMCFNVILQVSLGKSTLVSNSLLSTDCAF